HPVLLPARPGGGDGGGDGRILAPPGARRDGPSAHAGQALLGWVSGLAGPGGSARCLGDPAPGTHRDDADRGAPDDPGAEHQRDHRLAPGVQLLRRPDRGQHALMPHCPVCDAALGQGLLFWLLRCPGCGFERSTLAEQLANPRARAAIDEDARAAGLGALRERNFRTIVGALDRLRPERGALLDVGCAHGWFLRAAAESGWSVLGIEPDPEMARLAASGGREVRRGMFPSALKPGERFDAI